MSTLIVSPSPHFILALDTSTEACSVALSAAGAVSQKFELIPRLHARKLLPMVRQLLDESGVSLQDIDAIAFTCGPGSFTGLRIAASVTQGLAFGLNVRVVAVSTLAVLAAGARREFQCGAALPVLDARMKEIYWGQYDLAQPTPRLLGEEVLSEPEQIDAAPGKENSKWVGVGSGWRLADQFPSSLIECMSHIEVDFHPQARDVAELASQMLADGDTVAAEQALPVYMRGASAWKKIGEQGGAAKKVPVTKPGTP